MLLLTFDGQLGTAPPNSKDANIKAGRVLDIGTGTGIWAMDFADEHPEAEVCKRLFLSKTTRCLLTSQNQIRSSVSTFQLSSQHCMSNL